MNIYGKRRVIGHNWRLRRLYSRLYIRLLLLLPLLVCWDEFISNFPQKVLGYPWKSVFLQATRVSSVLWHIINRCEVFAICLLFHCRVATYLYQCLVDFSHLLRCSIRSGYSEMFCAKCCLCCRYVRTYAHTHIHTSMVWTKHLLRTFVLDNNK
jgi:hypothetical protein